jgi:hypothetical protein
MLQEDNVAIKQYYEDDDFSKLDSAKLNQIVYNEILNLEERKNKLRDYGSMDKILKPEEDLTGNEFLERTDLNKQEKSFILGKVMTQKYLNNIKSIDSCTVNELHEFSNSFPSMSKQAESHLNFLNPEYNEKHLQFLNKSYHEFLNINNFKQSFVPHELSKAKHFFIMRAGPVGLVFAINVLLRGHRAILIDDRKFDERERYIGILPKFVVDLTNFGVAPSGFVKWVVLNATNDKTPKL